MQFEFEGKTYQYDPERIDVASAMAIRTHCNMGLLSWQNAVNDMDPLACQALLWVIKRQNGEACEIGTLNFSMVAFNRALAEAGERETKRTKAEAAAAATTPDPTAVGLAESTISEPTPILDTSEPSISSS